MKKDFDIKQEISRKIFHIFLLIFPFLYYQIGRWEFLKYIAPIAIIIFAIDHFRHKNDKISALVEKVFGKIMRQKELEKGVYSGLSNVLAASVLLALISKEIIFIASFLILAFCDSLASIFGKAIKSEKFFEKSVAGSCTFFVSGILVLLFCGNFFHASLWFYFFGFFALFCATIIEARPSLFDFDDNFSIPVSFAVIMSAFDLIWSFL